MHGYAGCAETWEYQINHFASKYRVVVPDLRGHGQSDAPYTQYTMEELVADLQQALGETQHPHADDLLRLERKAQGVEIVIEPAFGHETPERPAGRTGQWNLTRRGSGQARPCSKAALSRPI